MGVPGMLDALIFDVDGTLAETEEIHRAAFNRTFVESGLDWSWDQALYGELLKVTGGKERMLHFIETARPPSRPAGDLEAAVAAMHKRKTALYGEMIAAGDVALRPGIGSLIAAARTAGVRLAIATTTSRPNVEALLDATLGEASRTTFEVIVAGDEVKNKKPAPDVYIEALQLLRLAPDRCLALEDSWNGVRSALGAGLPVLVTRGMYTAGDRFDGALAVLGGLAELADGVDGEAIGPDLLAAVRLIHASRGAIRGGERRAAS